MDLHRLLSLPREIRLNIWGFVFHRAIHIQSDHKELQQYPCIQIPPVSQISFACQAECSEHDYYEASRTRDYRSLPVGEAMAPIEHHLPCCITFTSQPRSMWSVDLRCIRACRLLYQELQPVLYSTTMFCFLDRRFFLTFMSRIGHGNASQIREIWLEWPAMARHAFDELPSWIIPDEKAFPALPELRTLHIRINRASSTTARKWLKMLEKWPTDTNYARIRMYDLKNETAVTNEGWSSAEPLIRGLFISNDRWSLQEKMRLVELTRSILVDSIELSESAATDAGEFIANLRICCPTINDPTFYPDSMLKRAVYQNALEIIFRWLSTARVSGRTSQIWLPADYGPGDGSIDPDLLKPVIDHILNIHLLITIRIGSQKSMFTTAYGDLRRSVSWMVSLVKVMHKQDSYSDCAFCPPVEDVRAIWGAMQIPGNCTQEISSGPNGPSKN